MRICDDCGRSFAATHAAATYCSGRCRTAVWRRRRARLATQSHELLVRNAELTRARLAAAVAGDPTAVAEADRLLDELERNAAVLFGRRP